MDHLRAAVVAEHALGGISSQKLSPPPLSGLDDLRAWLDVRDPATVGVAVVRLVALVVAYRLVGTIVLAVLGRATRLPALVATAERLTAPPLRGIVRRSAGLALSASAVLVTSPLAAAAGAGAGPRRGDLVERIDPDAAARGVVVERLDPRQPAHASTATLRLLRPAARSLGSGTASMRLVPAEPGGGGPSGDGTATLAPVPAPDRSTDAPPAPTDAARPTDASSTVHRVVPGDHLWGLSAARLGEHLGRPATDAEVDPYWRRVVAANPQLADPDLLYPGDPVTLPPVP